MINFDFLKMADEAALQVEQAKMALEKAKSELDHSKNYYEEIFSQCEENGIPKAKLKKLLEERLQTLIESGLVSLSATGNSKPAAEKASASEKSSSPQKSEKSKKQKKETSSESLLELNPSQSEKPGSSASLDENSIDLETESKNSDKHLDQNPHLDL